MFRIVNGMPPVYPDDFVPWNYDIHNYYTGETNNYKAVIVIKRNSSKKGFRDFNNLPVEIKNAPN